MNADQTRWAIAMRRCSWVAAGLSLVVLIALVWNAFASRTSDPNPPTRVDELVTRINLDPSNKPLLESLRKQDVWLRASYFRSVQFSQTGFVLLLGGVFAFLVFAKAADRLSGKPARPNPNEPIRNASELLGAQRTVLVLGMGMGGVLAMVATLSRHDSVAAYVAAKPLPQVTPVAPSAPQSLPIASPGAGTAAPAATSAASASSVTSAPSGPTTLGGTSLAPLPITGGAAAPPNAHNPGKPIRVSVAPVESSGDWPCFRGLGAGTVPAWKGPADWDAVSGKGILWKVDLDLPGWNSPIVQGGKVFLAGADDKHREICAFDLVTGKSLWRLGIPVLAGTKPVKPSPDAGYAPSTMATDGKRVFAAFVDGNVVCVSVGGKALWGRGFGPLENNYGFACSLLVTGGKLIVQVDQGSSPDEGKSVLYGLDPQTGNTVWQTKRTVSASWSSPVATVLGGKPAVVVVASPSIAAYDASSGSEIWHADGLSGEIAASSAFGDGRFFIGQQGSYLMAVDATSGKVVWKTSDPALPDIASLVYGKGLVFLVTSDGTFSAIDGASGMIAWEKRVDKPAKSSPVVVGDQVYLLGTDGTLRTFLASRTFQPLAQHRLGETAEATPAFVGARMLLRGEHHLFCVGAK